MVSWIPLSSTELQNNGDSEVAGDVSPAVLEGLSEAT